MKKDFRHQLIKSLIDTKLIERRDLKKALRIHQRTGGRLRDILIVQGIISQKDLMLVMSRELNIPPMNLSKYKIDPSVARLIPEKIAKRYSLVAISKMGDTLTIAMTDPLNVFVLDDVKMLTHYKIDPILATENDIREAINSYYAEGTQELEKELEQLKLEDIEIVEKEKLDIGEIAKESQRAPIVKIVALILEEAIKKRASDIHIEPCENSLRVRYRIDGDLHEAFSLPKENQNAVLARLKIISKLDITETRFPHDGRFSISLEDKEIDFRVSVLPIAFGGKVVLRALDKSSLSVGLDKLGFLPAPLETFKQALRRPYGMILITGPTGSGKSTTLYSIVNKLNSPERNIVTLEDPVEYNVEGVTQIQVRPEIGLTFAGGLKAILRQSPDVIMVGEIRDFETADIAIKASLTGEIILSTLHTNDAVGAITRLVDMGVEPFLIASSLVMAGAQRLIRKICPYCKAEQKIPENVLERAGLDKKSAKGHFYTGKGCPKCNNTGYYGRAGILEAFLIDDAIRDMITKRATSDEIKDYVVRHGMRSLRENALENFVIGETTLEEVLRVTAEE